MPAAWSALLAVVLLWPLHRAGYPIARDMVFTPHPELSWASVGLGVGAPRAVPVDALVALASSVLGGAIVSRIALFGALILAGAGAAALVGALRRPLGATAAASLAVWNPYVIERLAMGNWSLLWAYAALPWIVLLARRARDGGATAPMLIWVAVASITPTGGLLAALTAVACLWPTGSRDRSERRHRRWALGAFATLALQLPWVVPALVGAAGLTSDPAGAASFASRSEHAGGVVTTLLGGGGAWNATAVPPSRSGWLAFAALLLLVVAGLGWRPARASLGGASLNRLACCAGVGFVLALASGLPGPDAVARWALSAIPGAGIFRDAQKWLLPAVLLVAVLFGYGVARLTTVGAGRFAVAALALLAPLLLLPDAASTLRPVFDPAHYPSDWSWAAAETGHRGPGHDGAVLVLPFQPYRSFAWTPGRPVLDPAPRLLPGAVIVSDRLTVSGRTLRSEDERVQRVAALLSERAASASRLAIEGIGWVLVEHDTPGRIPRLHGLRTVRAGPALTLYRVPGPITSVQPGIGQRLAVLCADGLAVLVLLGSFVILNRHRGRLLG